MIHDYHAWLVEQAGADAQPSKTSGAQRRVKKKVSWRKGGDDVAAAAGPSSSGASLEERLSESEQAMSEPFTWKVSCEEPLLQAVPAGAVLYISPSQENASLICSDLLGLLSVNTTWTGKWAALAADLQVLALTRRYR